MIADADSDRQHVLVADPWFDQIGRKLENFQEAPVENLEPILCIVKAEALRHVFQGSIEQQVRLTKRPFLLLEPTDVAAENDEAAIAGRAAA